VVVPKRRKRPVCALLRTSAGGTLRHLTEDRELTMILSDEAQVCQKSQEMPPGDSRVTDYLSNRKLVRGDLGSQILQALITIVADRPGGEEDCWLGRERSQGLHQISL
jgi:hypothetical protein